jgi:hypothetical protein
VRKSRKTSSHSDQARCLFGVIRDRAKQAASPTTSAMPPKAEGNSKRHRHGPLRVDGAAGEAFCGARALYTRATASPDVMEMPTREPAGQRAIASCPPDLTSTRSREESPHSIYVYMCRRSRPDRHGPQSCRWPRRPPSLYRPALTAKFEKRHSFRCPDDVTSSTRIPRLDARSRPRIGRQAPRISAIIRP